MVNTFVVRQKVDLRRTFHFDTRIYPEVRGFINLISELVYACSPVLFRRYGSVEVENWLKLKFMQYVYIPINISCLSVNLTSQQQHRSRFFEHSGKNPRYQYKYKNPDRRLREYNSRPFIFQYIK